MISEKLIITMKYSLNLVQSFRLSFRINYKYLVNLYEPSMFSMIRTKGAIAMVIKGDTQRQF